MKETIIALIKVIKYNGFLKTWNLVTLNYDTITFIDAYGIEHTWKKETVKLKQVSQNMTPVCTCPDKTDT